MTVNKPINLWTPEERKALFFKDGVYRGDIAGYYAQDHPPTYTKDRNWKKIFEEARAEGLAEGQKERGEAEE